MSQAHICVDTVTISTEKWNYTVFFFYRGGNAVRQIIKLGSRGGDQAGVTRIPNERHKR